MRSEPAIAIMAPVVPEVRTSRLEISMMHPPEQVAGVAWRSLEWPIARKRSIDDARKVAEDSKTD
jgi:hypothetical protein